MPLPDSPSQQTGGYRRKADMLGHGRNTRLKYTAYTPYDNRMMPESAARLLENSNRPISSRTVQTEDILSGEIEMTDYTHQTTFNSADDQWQLEFDWTVSNTYTQNKDYRIYLVITDGAAFQLGGATTFTATADSETDEVGEVVDVVAGGGPTGNVTALLRIVDDGTSETLYETGTFAFEIPEISITMALGLFYPVSSTRYTYAAPTFEAVRFSTYFYDTVPTTHSNRSYTITLYWREVGQPTWNTVTSFDYGDTSSITTTANGVQHIHTRHYTAADPGGGANIEGYYQLVMVGTPPVQNYTVTGRFVTVSALTLPPLEDEVLATTTVPETIETQVNPDAQTASGYGNLLTEPDVDSLDITYYVETPAGAPIASAVIPVTGVFWNSNPRHHSFTSISSGSYKVGYKIEKVYDDTSREDVQPKTLSNATHTVLGPGVVYGSFFILSDHFNTTPDTIVENATYTHANCGFDDTNNELEFIDTSGGAGPTWGTAAVDIRPDPNPETWVHWLPTWRDDFDMVMDFQFTGSGFPSTGSDGEKALDIQTTPNDYSDVYHLGCAAQYTGTALELKIKPHMMWYDRTDAKGGGTVAYPMFSISPTTYTSNTILGTGDNIFGASSTRYVLTWKYRAVDIGGGSYAGTLRHYINGYFQGQWTSSEPAEAYDEVYHHRGTDGLRIFSKYYGAKVYEYSIKGAAPHESQDKATAVPTYSLSAPTTTAFDVIFNSITVNVPATTYNLYVRYNGTVFGPAAGGPYTAAQVASSNPSVTVNSGVSLDGVTATDFELLLRPSTWDSTAGLENYLGEFKITTVITPPEPAFNFTTLTGSIVKQSSVAFDVVLDSFTGLTTFDPTYNQNYTITLDVKHLGSSLHQEATQWNTDTESLSKKLYTADRLDADASWWRSWTSSRTFTVDYIVSYVFNTGGWNHSFSVGTVTGVATTASIPPALIWRFKDNNSSLADIDGHGITWAVQAGTESYNSTNMTTVTDLFDMRLVNTGSAVSSAITSLGLKQDFRLAVKGAFATDADAAVWAFSNVSPEQGSLTYISHSFYHPNTTAQAFQDPSPNFLYNFNYTGFVKTDFNTLHEYIHEYVSEVENDGNTTNIRRVYKDGLQYDKGATITSGEIDLFYSTDVTMYTKFTMQNTGSELHYVALYPVDKISKLDLSSFTVLSQVSYDTTGGTWDFAKVYNNNYGTTQIDHREWIAVDTTEEHLWVWLDLGVAHTLDYIQWWQNKITGHGNRIKGLQMHITDVNPGATPAKYSGSDWMFDFHADTEADWYWVTTDKEYIAGTLADKANVGSGNSGAGKDPSSPYTSAVDTGYYEFHFNHRTTTARRGRYLYMQFQRRNATGQARLYEIDLYGVT